MSRRNRITNAKAQKLRSGHTYWRCQIQPDGSVNVYEGFLKGSKFISVMRSMFPENVPEKKRKVLGVSVKIGPKDPAKWSRGYYLSSVNPGSSINSFTTRRAAQRWKREVEAGLHPQAVADAMEHWDFCDNLTCTTTTTATIRSMTTTARTTTVTDEPEYVGTLEGELHA
jgi:hypothetical protein